MRIPLKKTILTAVATVGVTVGGFAASINLYNTGVDVSGTPLPDGTLDDPHYTLISVPGGSTTVRVRTSAGGWPIGPWMEDDSISAWIGPNNTSVLDGPGGLYTYRTTFDLTGLDPSTASISGIWVMDDFGRDILLNGVSQGCTSDSFASWSPFSILSGFLPGINTLDFIIDQTGGGPTGLRVEMQGIAEAVSTPDAGSTVFLLGGACVLLSVFRRKLEKVLRHERSQPQS